MTLPSCGLTQGCAREHLTSFTEARPAQQLLCAAGKGGNILGSFFFFLFETGLMFCVPMVSYSLLFR